MSGPEVHPGEPPACGPVVFARSWPSRVDRKQDYLDELADALIGRGWVAAADREWLGLCLDEVLVNAMLHGNEGDPRLPIEVALHDAGAQWVLLVADRGEGFRPGDVPDIEDPESLLLEHGRGIRIMGEWLDRLAYYRGGSTALLARRKTAT